MPVSHRHLIAIAAAAIALIALALAIKISRAVPDFFPPQVTRVLQIPYATAPSFFERAKGNPAVTSGGQKPAASAPRKYPGVTARAIIVGNVKTGQVYMSDNDSARLPVASMSKLVTAIAATDRMKLDDVVEITEAEATETPDTAALMAGERFTVRELLYPMLLNSSNIAAEALASSSNRQKFLEDMSSYAWEIGMPATYFADPSGINPNNAASAKDLFALAQYLYKYRPDILELTRTEHASTATTTDHGSHVFTSIHPFVTDPDFLGGKTGHTPEAGDTMMTILNVNGEPVAFIILGADSGARAADTRALRALLGTTLAGK